MASIINASTSGAGGVITTADASGVLNIQTASTTAMTIDASQNVGIGTASPAQKLDIRTNTTGDTNINIWNEYSGAAYAANVNLIAANTSGSYYNAVIAKNSAGTATWRIDGAGTADTFRISTGSGYTERMRIDSSGNLLFNSGYGSAATAYGCRAWVNFNGTGTVAIRASGNVTSITDNGTGNYTINFTTAMVDANYGLVGTCHGSGGATFQIDTSIYSTTACTILTRIGGTATDTNIVNSALFR